MRKKHLAVFAAVLLILSLLTGCTMKSVVKLGQYKGLTYTPVDTTVTQEEVDAYIKTVIDNNAQSERDDSREGTPVAEGDKINVDYVGSIDGVEFEGGNSMGQGVDITIGSGRMIPGFEESLIGKTIGEETVIDVTFPDPYSVNPDLSGMDAQFKIDIHYAYKTVEVEYNDTFIYELTQGEYSTVKAYETYIRESMVDEKEQKAQQDELEEVLQKALANCTFNMNPKDAEPYHDEFVAYYQQMAAMYGFTKVDDYIESIGGTMDQFETAANSYASDTLAAKLFYDEVAKEEGISVSDEEYEARIQEYMTNFGATDRAQFEETYTVDVIRENMLYDILNEKLMEWSVPEN